MAEHYAAAGVSLEAGYKSVELIKEHVKKTMRPEVLGGLGGFSGAFSLSKIKDMEEPVLLSGTDGCGTKVKLAMVMNKHDTIGIDAVAMCVNEPPSREPDTANWYRIRTVSGGAIISAEDLTRATILP